MRPPHYRATALHTALPTTPVTNRIRATVHTAMPNPYRPRYRTVPIVLASLFLLTRTPAAEPPREILLWPNGAPGSAGKTGDEQVRITETGEHVLSNIHKPSLPDRK